MAWSVDGRIPVRLGAAEDVGAGDAILVEGTLPAGEVGEEFEPGGHEPGEHGAACACCVARSPAAAALDRLFQRRVRGQVAFFRRVVALTATADGALAVWVAVRNDPVTSARYRLEDTSPPS